MNTDPQKSNYSWEESVIEEKKKRRKEFKVVIFLLSAFLFLTFIEFRLFDISESLPFVHSIFFFGLVNFNIILFLALIFMIFRNVVKLYTEKEKGVFGSTLKGKLITAFMAFSTVPTILMFLISLVYLNHSFNRWFGEKISGVLKSSLEVTNEYYVSEKKKNYHFANELSLEINKEDSRREVLEKIKSARKKFDLDLVHYVNTSGVRFYSANKSLSLPKNIKVKASFIKKGAEKRLESSLIEPTEHGNFVRVIVPIVSQKNAAIVVTSFIGIPVLSKIDEIAGVYSEIRNINPLEYPIKSIYLNILIVITLVILLFASWFGFYLARQLAIPLQVLGSATKDISKGDYKSISYQSGSKEVNHLIKNFNAMSRELQISEFELQQANKTLKSTLLRLDQHSKYIEVVMANVTTGVISVDDNGFIIMVNSHAQKLLGLKNPQFLEKMADEVLPAEYYEAFKHLLETMAVHGISHLKKEVKINIKKRQVPFQISVSVLFDEFKNEIGKVFVFDDLTPLLKAQRTAAWSEVASRLAHEVKNPLTPIKLSAERLKKKFAHKIDDSSFLECTNMIIEQTEGLRDLVNEFGNFARLPQSKPRLCNLNELISQVVSIYKTVGIAKGTDEKPNKSENQVEFVFRADAKLPKFMFDQEQMRRALINLLDNAVMATSGQLGPSVEVYTEFLAEHQIVQLHIKDNGPGLEIGMESKIFEAYMTTKENGVGLGLAIVKRTIEDHNGVVRAYNKKPNGVHIIIELPLEMSSSIEYSSDQLMGANNKVQEEQSPI